MFCGCSTAFDGSRRPTATSARSASGCRARCRSSTGGPSSTCSRPGWRSGPTTPAKTALGAQELLLPRPAQGLPDQPVRDPARCDGRLTFDTSDGPFTVAITPRAPRGGHGQADPRARRPTGGRVSLVDFNRSGAPLMEIVTEPDIRTAEQARRYAEELQLLLRAIGASDADMERGQMRVEANVSLRPRGTEPFGTRVEVKNMNSFRVGRAGDRATRSSARRPRSTPARRSSRRRAAGTTTAARPTACGSRRSSDDYRYFPEPDLPPLHGRGGAGSTRSGQRLPELPAARRARYVAPRACRPTTPR